MPPLLSYLCLQQFYCNILRLIKGWSFRYLSKLEFFISLLHQKVRLSACLARLALPPVAIRPLSLGGLVYWATDALIVYSQLSQLRRLYQSVPLLTPDLRRNFMHLHCASVSGIDGTVLSQMRVVCGLSMRAFVYFACVPVTRVRFPIGSPPRPLRRLDRLPQSTRCLTNIPSSNAMPTKSLSPDRNFQGFVLRIDTHLQLPLRRLPLVLSML